MVAMIHGRLDRQDGVQVVAILLMPMVMNCLQCFHHSGQVRCISGDGSWDELMCSGRMKLRHTILKGESKPCPRRLYS